MRQLKSAMAVVFFLSGFLAIAAGVSPTSRSYTDGTQQITDGHYGLANSPLYTYHREEPVGGIEAAFDREERVVIVAHRQSNLLSWSGLLVASGIVAMTLSLVAVRRMRIREDRPAEKVPVSPGAQ